MNLVRALARGEKALATARDMVAGGHHEASVSSAYYAALFAGRALLLTLGIEPKTHDGVRHLISEHFVKPGKLPRDVNTSLAGLQKNREDADYSLDASFDADDAEEAIAGAERFAGLVRQLLAQGGWLATR